MSSTRVDLPNGNWIDVPDDLPEEDRKRLKLNLAAAFPDATPSRGITGTLQDLAVMGVKGAVGLDQAALGIADIVLPPVAQEHITGPWQKRMTQAQEGLGEMYTLQQQAANKKLQQSMERGLTPTLETIIEQPGATAVTIGESIPLMVGGGGVARGLLSQVPKMAPWVAGAAGEGIVGAGSAASQIRGEQKGAPVNAYQQLAAIGSGITTGMVAGGSGKIAAKLGLPDIDRMLAEGKLTPQQGGFWKSVFGAGFTEGMLEEMPQSAFEQMWQNYALNEPLTKGVGGQMALGGVAGTGFGGLVGGYNAAVAPRAEKVEEGKELGVMPGKPPEVPPPSTPPRPPTIEATQQPPADIPEHFTDAQQSREANDILVQQIMDEMDTGKINLNEPIVADEQPAPAHPLNPQFEGMNEEFVAALLRDTGLTPEVFANKDNFDDPNTNVPMLDRLIMRVISASRQTQAKVGARLKDLVEGNLDTSQGPVILQVGVASDVRPDFYLKGFMEELYDRLAELGSTGVYVVLPTDLQVRGDARGVSGGHFFLRGIHFISPRHLSNINKKGSHWLKEGENAYSSYAKFDAWSTLHHEFGHAIAIDHLYEGLTPSEISAFKLGIAQNNIDPALFGKLTPEAQELVKRWLAFRGEVKGNKISGKEAAARWLSPAKLQKKVTFEELPGGIEGEWTAKNLNDVLNQYDDRLSLEEYVAEQAAKYYYAQGKVESSKMLEAVSGGKYEGEKFASAIDARLAAFFQPLINKLQKFFHFLKSKDIVGAEKEFGDWIEGIARRNKEKAAGKQASKVAEKPYVEEAIDWSVPSNDNRLKAALSSLVRTKQLNGNSREYKELRRLWVNSEYVELLEKLTPYFDGQIKFDIDSWREVKVKNWGPIKQKAVGWFGDSVVVDPYAGKPLPVFYARGTDITIGDRTVSLFFNDPISTSWVAGLLRQEPMSRKIIGGYLRFSPGRTVTINLPADQPITPTSFVQEVQKHIRRQDIDGIVISGGASIGVKGNIYIPVDPNAVAVDPEMDFQERTIHFDLTDPEEAELASKWQVVKSLGNDTLASSIARITKVNFYILTIAQIAHLHPEWHWFKSFRLNQMKFYRRASELVSRAESALKLYHESLGKEWQAKLDKLTTAEYHSGEHWTDITQEAGPDGTKHTVHVPSAKLLEKLQEHGVNTNTLPGKRVLAVYMAAKNGISYQQDELEQALINIRVQKYAQHPNQQLFKQKIAEVIYAFRALRQQPFWPQTTFGRFRVWVDRKVGNSVVRVFEAATDSEREWAEIEQKARKRYAGQEFVVNSDKKIFNEYALVMRLPVEFLDDLAIALGLDNSQLNPMDPKDAELIKENNEKLEEIRALMQSMYSKSSEKIFDPMKRVVEGGSTDFARKYADFTMRTANFIAKMEYRKLFDVDLQNAKMISRSMPAGYQKAEVERARSLLHDTLLYMMDPNEEAHKIRAVIALSYLVGSISTAVMNFFGLMYTWGYLNRELGYFKGTVGFGRSVGAAAKTLAFEGKDRAVALLRGAGDQAIRSVTDPTWEVDVEGKPTELRQAVDQAKGENVLDQSYMYYLAGQNSRASLARLTNRWWGKGLKTTIDLGMAPFRVGELTIRRATFIAVYRALQHTRPKWTAQQRYEEAVNVTFNTQGDYTKGNRPRIMRGQLLSIATIFMTFIQNATWQTYGGMETGLRRQERLEGRMTQPMYRNYSLQMILILLVVAGLEGLPFAENLFDVLDFIWKKWVTPGKSARTALREQLEQVTDNPMQYVHGLGFDVGGFDISRAAGLGRVVPGTDILTKNYGPTAEAIGIVAPAVFGVAGGYATWLFDTFARLSMAAEYGGVEALPKAMGGQLARAPGGIGHVAKAFQWAQYDARNHTSGLIAWEDGEPRSIMWWEIAGKAAGFNPTSVSEGQKRHAAQNDAIEYWRERKQWVYHNYFQAAYVSKDREAIADAKKAREKFDKEVPFREMRVSDADLRRSMKMRAKAAEESTKLQPRQKSYRPLAEEIQGSF